jgi:hypothetical protein
MPRSATSAVRSEWGKSLNRPVHLLEFDFQPWVYMTDAWRQISWNGGLYLASKFPLSVSGFGETADLLVNNCTITLSGVDQTIIATLLRESYFDRTVIVRLAMLDEAHNVIADPVQVFVGRMGRPAIATDPDGGTCTCSIECSSAWADFERTPGRRTNDAEQQTFFPGDRGFEHVEKIPAQIFWGRNTSIVRDSPANTRWPR